jgi:hypothetical protein
MTEKVTSGNLPGFSAAETMIMAAAWYHARSADVMYLFISRLAL